MTTTDEAEHPCATCGEPTLNPRLCRECNIEEMMEDARCPECRAAIWDRNAMTLGMQPLAHEPTCVSGRIERAEGIEMIACALFLDRRGIDWWSGKPKGARRG